MKNAERITLGDLALMVRSAFHPLRILREQKGLSLRKLSALSGISWMGIHFIETLHYKCTKTDSIFKLATALKVDPAALYVACLEYSMEPVPEGTRRAPNGNTRKEGEGPPGMLARLLHRELHPFNYYLLNPDYRDLNEVGISRSAWGNWMDKRTQPQRDSILKVSAKFGVSCEYLLTELKTWYNEDITTDPVGYIEKHMHKLEEVTNGSDE